MGGSGPETEDRGPGDGNDAKGFSKGVSWMARDREFGGGGLRPAGEHGERASGSDSGGRRRTSGAAGTPTGPVPQFEDDPIGFASVPPGTSGGRGGAIVTATTYDELARYLRLSEPQVIKVAGTITLRGMLNVSSNKSILGVGSSARIVKGGFNLSGVANVVIRNLTFEELAGRRDQYAGRRAPRLGRSQRLCAGL